MPFDQLAHEPQPDSKSETEEEEEQGEDEVHFSHGEEESSESEAAEEPEGVWQVTPQLDSGGTTPAKIPPVPNIRACSKSPPKKLKIKRQISPRDTPGREAVARQNAAPDDLMDEEVSRWQMAAVEPRKKLFC